MKKSIVVIVILVLLSFGAYVASQNVCGISFNGIERCGKYAGDVPDVGAYESERRIDRPKNNIIKAAKKLIKKVFG